VSEVIVSVDIDAPPEVVFDTMLDPRRLHEWVTIHRELLHADDGTPAEGMRMQNSCACAGATFKVDWELTDCDRPAHARWKGKGPARSKAETEYRLSARRRRHPLLLPQRVHRAVRARSAPWPRARWWAGCPEVEARRSLANLKALLEG
jgi:hypothetical protein